MEGQNGEQAAEQAIIGGGQDLLARLTGNLGIRAKLLLSFLVILALTVIVAIVALVGQRSAGRADEEMSQGQSLRQSGQVSRIPTKERTAGPAVFVSRLRLARFDIRRLIVL